MNQGAGFGPLQIMGRLQGRAEPAQLQHRELPPCPPPLEEGIQCKFALCIHSVAFMFYVKKATAFPRCTHFTV